MKKFSKILDYAHRYLGLIIFLQVIIWSFSGFFMYFLDFSDLYDMPPDKAVDLNADIPGIPELKTIISQKYPEVEIMAVSLKNIAGKPYYEIKAAKKEFVIGQERQIIEQLPENIITTVAEEKYTGKGKILKTELLQTSEGNYYSSRPIYRVTFDDQQKSEIYINPVNGKVLAKRKALWSFYNTMWEYHLMKYTPNQKLNKNLLLLSAVISLFVAVTGFAKFFRRYPTLK